MLLSEGLSSRGTRGWGKYPQGQGYKNEEVGGGLECAPCFPRPYKPPKEKRSHLNICIWRAECSSRGLRLTEVSSLSTIPAPCCLLLPVCVSDSLCVKGFSWEFRIAARSTSSNLGQTWWPPPPPARSLTRVSPLHLQSLRPLIRKMRMTIPASAGS